MRAIIANYMPVTNTLPRRIKVSAGDAPRMTFSLDRMENESGYNETSDEVAPYKLAAMLYCEMLGWPVHGYSSGSTKSGYVFVRGEA